MSASWAVESLATMVASPAHLHLSMKRTDAIYEFGPFRLEVGERRLLRSGQPLQPRAKVFDALRVLVQNHGRLVRKDEPTHEHCWRNRRKRSANWDARKIYLRLMPAGGGVPKNIAYVFGGQGTINVPSWSPDSKRIAFVSNTQIK